MTLRYAYNTNGLQNHRLEHALELVARAGYDGVALTLDIHHLDPLAPDLEGRARCVRDRLRRLGLASVIETGARFLLDPWVKHEPTLISASGRGRRGEFLRRAVDAAAVLESEAVSFWAGVPRGVQPDWAWERFAEGAAEVAAYARQCGVRVALEPEPGMLIETLADWSRARDLIGETLGLALDVGHLLVTGEDEPAEAIAAHALELATVTVEDMRCGEHVHLPFGQGHLDLPATLHALHAIGWRGLVCVELSRDSHRAPEMVAAALAALREAERTAPPPDRDRSPAAATSQ